MNADKARAILSSAYNVCGPRSGAPATPAAVDGLCRTTLKECADLYAEHVESDPDALFTPAEVHAAADLMGL